ncbi:hypothetical protein IQ266_12050 [filamentous cyanobacterium LEGE 11480]|uniref:Uncharacterized protein n=1 Tax=Romeriopsis navalis LEGE 11480 TaxID=2777977 RepID=A0A928VKV5_9CYAN|nr:hypothetical protein [Romeriopsis navalis]MBE9030463.1 hypothetical protein [Romeriopsis navalis LEGE 11480]
MSAFKPRLKPQSGRSQETEPLLAGDSILEKLLSQMPQENRELVLRLISELGIPKDDPSLPLLIAMQFYVNLLQEIPSAMDASADAALKQSLQAYASLQGNLSGTVQEIDQVRGQWLHDSRRLFADVHTIFESCKQKAVQQYDTEVTQLNQFKLEQFTTDWRDVQAEYALDIRRQGIWHSFGAGLAGLLLVVPLAGWMGWQMKYLETFTRSDGLFFVEMAEFRDNRQRLDHCRKTMQRNGGKCTFWIEPR